MATPTKPPAINPLRDARVEKWLLDRGIGFTFHSAVPLEDFDFAASLKNQARIEVPIDQETVNDYALAMKNGDIFPPVIAYRGTNGKLIIIDGNHRLLAAQMVKSDVLSVYIVNANTPALTIMSLTYVANIPNGKGQSKADRLRHAMYLVNAGATQETAAAEHLITKTELTDAIAVYNADLKFKQLGIKNSIRDSFSKASKKRLNTSTIRSDEAFKAVVNLAYTARLSSGQLGDVIARLKPIKSSAAQIQFIKGELATEMQEKIDATGGGILKPNRSPRHTASMQAKALVATLVRREDVILDGISATEATSLAVTLGTTQDAINHMLKFLKEKLDA